MGFNNHHHHYYDYDRPSYHYHHHIYNNNNGHSNSNTVITSSTTTTTTTTSNGNTANGNNTSVNSSGQNENTNIKNPNYLNNGPNTGTNQNMQNNQSNVNNVFESSPPLVYSISGQNKINEDDSTEIVFSNSYLIVGVENLLLYGEFHDDKDIMMIIDQECDGLDPYEWQYLDPIAQSNATSVTAPIESQTVMNNQTTNTTTEKNEKNLF